MTHEERRMCEGIMANEDSLASDIVTIARNKLVDGGVYEVVDPTFLTGANISINITKEFMEAVEKDGKYDLRFPDLDNLTKEQKKFYDEK